MTRKPKPLQRWCYSMSPSPIFWNIVLINFFFCSYPAVYIICILPNTISRWLTFSGHHPPGGFILFANTIFSLSGLFNLILFLLTRPAMVVGNDITVESLPLTHKPVPSDYTSSTLGHLPENSPPSDMEKQNSPVSPTTLPSSRGAASVNNHLSVDREHYTRPQSSEEDGDHGHLPGWRHWPEYSLEIWSSRTLILDNM